MKPFMTSTSTSGLHGGSYDPIQDSLQMRCKALQASYTQPMKHVPFQVRLVLYEDDRRSSPIVDTWDVS